MFGFKSKKVKGDQIMGELKVGIDLGTTNSACATLVNGKFEYLKYKGGKHLLPSTILWQDGQLTIGEKAKRISVLYPENFIKSSKIYMGDFEKIWKIDKRKFTATDVAAEILTAIREEAESKYNTQEKITAVITVPAYFSSNQIGETKKAAEMAGFEVKQIITEPVAAAIAYGFDDNTDQKLFVVDIGGGTFDVSILEVQGNSFKTIAIDGDKRLGGDDFDQILLNMCVREIKESLGLDLSSAEQCELSKEEFSRAKQRLILEVENKKIELSESEKVEIEIPNLLTYKGKNYNFTMPLTRQKFEEESSQLFDKIKNIMERCLEEASMTPSEIDKVILVGGTAYIPCIQSYVKNLFKKDPYSDKPLERLVVMGAALIADDERDAITVLDIISHSLGIEVIGKEFEKILVKNDRYPISKAKLFTTSYDFQRAVCIAIFEGEDEACVDNNEFFGSFYLDNIEHAPAGEPRIEVSFSFDKSRDLTIVAKDINTGSEISLIKRKGRREDHKKEFLNMINEKVAA
ncbi:MAG: Hsp70 family protein [bacterium]